MSIQRRSSRRARRPGTPSWTPFLFHELCGWRKRLLQGPDYPGRGDQLARATGLRAERNLRNGGQALAGTSRLSCPLPVTLPAHCGPLPGELYEEIVQLKSPASLLVLGKLAKEHRPPRVAVESRGLVDQAWTAPRSRSLRVYFPKQYVPSMVFLLGKNPSKGGLWGCDVLYMFSRLTFRHV